MTEETHICSLCGLDFSGAACHSACPFSKGCEMVRCPRCGYEFVEKGLVVSLIRRLFRPSPERTSNDSPTR